MQRRSPAFQSLWALWQFWKKGTGHNHKMAAMGNKANLKMLGGSQNVQRFQAKCPPTVEAAASKWALSAKEMPPRQFALGKRCHLFSLEVVSKPRDILKPVDWWMWCFCLGRAQHFCQLIGNHLKVQYIFLFRPGPQDWTHQQAPRNI